MTRPSRHHIIVLDDEAVQALQSAAHPKYRQVMTYVERTVTRKRKVLLSRLVVPTSVRVEAGWDRTDPAWALANRLQIVDIRLDGPQANVATGIRRRVSPVVSVVDAHLGAVVQSADADRVTVITSDPIDMAAVAEATPAVIVAI